jgi:hypothetical protein
MSDPGPEAPDDPRITGSCTSITCGACGAELPKPLPAPPWECPCGLARRGRIVATTACVKAAFSEPGQDAAPGRRPGCCVDRASREEGIASGRPLHDLPEGCDNHTCMSIPDDHTCADCVHEKRCTTMFGAKPQNTTCGYFPRRFRLKVA